MGKIIAESLIFLSLYFTIPVHAAPPKSVVPLKNTSVSKTAAPHTISYHNVHMLAVFTRFSGEAPSDSPAPEWADSMFDESVGSIPHFWDTISFGQIGVTGEYLPKRYMLPHEASHYVNNFHGYVIDMLEILDSDPDVDLSLYDNDGPDGIPASGDDDGFLDYLALIPMTRPYGFIIRYATGYGNFGNIKTYESHYTDTDGEPIKIDKNSGCIATAGSLNEAVGTICHEFGHHLGGVDLYDNYYTNDENDSAGIGNWGLMGRGSIGWNLNNGPVPPNAYSRMRFGLIGRQNANLIDIYGSHRDLRIGDVALENGTVYRIWAGYNEYFLIEHRRNDGIYYDRDTPRNGLLIWHVYENVSSADELKKRCDLECADGRFSDAGYPFGMIPDPSNGGDNLDFWAHNSGYNSAHGGNLGDATDVYDGAAYTRFGPDTNPDTRSKVTGEQTGIEIYNIRADGNDMVFDVNIPPFSDWIGSNFNIIGTGYQRFMENSQTEDSMQKAASCYLLNDDCGLAFDKLVTIYDDSLTVEEIFSMTGFEVQKIIESRLFRDIRSAGNVGLIRENISYKRFKAEIMQQGLQIWNDASDIYPRSVQKISVTHENTGLPETIALSQNYPNPFNAQTTIRYLLPSDGAVSLELYNIVGQKVLDRDLGHKSAGGHTFVLNASDLSTGIYLYRISGSAVSETKKLLLIR